MIDSYPGVRKALSLAQLSSTSRVQSSPMVGDLGKTDLIDFRGIGGSSMWGTLALAEVIELETLLEQSLLHNARLMDP